MVAPNSVQRDERQTRAVSPDGASVSVAIRGGASSADRGVPPQSFMEWCDVKIMRCYKIAPEEGKKRIEEFNGRIEKMTQGGATSLDEFLKDPKIARLVTDSEKSLFEQFGGDRTVDTAQIQKTTAIVDEFFDKIEKFILMAHVNVDNAGMMPLLKSIPDLWLAHTTAYETRLSDAITQHMSCVSSLTERSIFREKEVTNTVRGQTFIENTKTITKHMKEYMAEKLPLPRAKTKLAIAGALHSRLGENSPVKDIENDLILKIFDFLFVPDRESPRYSIYELNVCSEQEINNMVQYARRRCIFENIGDRLLSVLPSDLDPDRMNDVTRMIEEKHNQHEVDEATFIKDAEQAYRHVFANLGDYVIDSDDIVDIDELDLT